MSKRNFILLIIILILIVFGIFIFLYFTGNTTVQKNVTDGTNFISKFNPFGNSKIIDTIPNQPAEIPTQPNETGEVIKTKLVKVSSMPIAGFTLFTKERLKDIPVLPINQPVDTATPVIPKTTTKKSTKPTPPPTEFAIAVRYIEKAKGIIYQTFADKIEERKFSITTIPKIYDAYFGNNGESVVMRHLKTNEETIESFAGNLPKEYLGADTTGNNEIKGYFLPENITDISVSPDGSKIFYLFNTQDNIVGTILNFKDNKKTQVFSSVFTEWLSSWGGDKNITLNTKPSSLELGYVYTINTDKKDFIKIFGNVNGLTSLISPNGKLLLYTDNSLSLKIYHTDTRTIDNLGLNTLPEKCVWGKVSDLLYCSIPKSINGGNYPDVWYQGKVSFDDQIWKLDLKNGNNTILIDPATITPFENIDGIKLAIDESESYLFFVNKKDNFLWKLDLK